MNMLELRGLGIIAPQISTASENFSLPAWPPPYYFPIVIDATGKVVSRYFHSVWDITCWSGKRTTLNFGDGEIRKGESCITPDNAFLLREITAWWIWGPGQAQSASLLWTRFSILRCLFVLCSEHGITASELTRFPKVAELLPGRIGPSHGSYALTLLHDLWRQRDALGFVILDEQGLKNLAAALPDHESQQTPYIPPRIWLYQVSRLRECLDDYLAHKEGIEACFQFALDAYAKNAGSLDQAFKSMPQSSRPFDPQNQRLTGERTGHQFLGPFRLTAERFGIDRVLDKWANTDKHLSIRAFGSYLTLIGHVGTAYLLNFSLMRIDEGALLRSDCLSIERDETGENIYILKGPTSKTIEDDDARWITSPSAIVAINAMRSAAELRNIAGMSNPSHKKKMSHEDIHNPILLCRSTEPWARRDKKSTTRKKPRSYSDVVKWYPKLFDGHKTRITEEDLKIARLITPDLDSEKFIVGEAWQFRWHQLRRTGAVNMRASGAVSDASVQYQLKHASRAMSRYYGQNYYHLKVRLNENSRSEYIRTMYEMVAREFSLLSSERFISPHGPTRKSQILNLATERDHKGLLAAAKAGKIAYRETWLGGCTNPGPPCPLGGISNICGCMGGTDGRPCEDVLLDKEKRPLVVKLGKVIATRLSESADGSMLRHSLQAQQRAIENTLHAIDHA
jgi:hypothetical protein